MKTTLWIILVVLTLSIGGFFLTSPDYLWGGDIIEYYGMTQSFLSHATPQLRPEDEEVLKHTLNPVYLKNPLWYIAGQDGYRWPVHFFFYSLLATPIRVVVELLHYNPIASLRILNILLLSATVAILFRFFVKNTFKRFALLLLVFLSPIVSFLIWPGPDVYYMCWLFIAAFAYLRKGYILAAFATVMASWQSQPLVILSAGMMFTAFFSHTTFSRPGWKLHINTSVKMIALSITLGALLIFPYVYNYMVFGVFTPWTIFTDVKTLLYGFGPQNMSLQKFYEQLFDLNMGLFWYAPVLFVVGFVCLFLHMKTKHYPTIILFVFLMITAFFYQTNPGWNFGTAGFGPSRHAIYLLPFLIAYVVHYTKESIRFGIIIFLFIATQVPILGANGFLMPNFLNSLSLSPFATFVLDRAPQLYNPSPEIFVIRVTHNDEMFPLSAFYKKDGQCKKAYVIYGQEDKLKKECGYIPKAAEKALRDPLLDRVSYTRQISTTEAMFWPDPYSCDFPTQSKVARCMFNIGEVMRFTGVKDASRFEKHKVFKGVWHLKWGPPVKVKVLPGYFIDRYSFDGTYVNYN